MQIQLPEHVKFIIETLNHAGHEAYAVGGCVRDCIMGRIPNDWDITTSADPMEVKALFRRTIDTGLQHGTVTIMMDKIGYEVTTYRIDGDYEDGRHPKQVTFTKSLEEDLKRRDFTVNAMAYNETEGLIDLFDGIGDMQRRVIRCVGEPIERFTEDALRIMRAVRFAAQFGYEIEARTKEAISKIAPNLQKISAERIRVELMKLLVSDHPDFLRIAYETGITAQMLPEFDLCMQTGQNNPHHCFSVGEHTLKGLQMVEADPVLRLSMLLHDIGKPQSKWVGEDGVDHFYGHPKKSAEMSKDILRRLKFDNDTIHKVLLLVREHDWTIPLAVECSEKTVRIQLARIGLDAFPDLFKIGRADLAAQSEYEQENKLKKLAHLETLYHEILRKNCCLTLKQLRVTGADLIAAGMRPGPGLGKVLNDMLSEVIDHPERNEREYLLSHLSDFWIETNHGAEDRAGKKEMKTQRTEEEDAQ